MSKRISDDPERLKGCKGCRETKPVREFYANGQGYPAAVCRVCHAAEVRAYHRRVSSNPAFRQARAEKERAAYAADPAKKKAGVSRTYWRQRPMDEGRMVRICNCHGKVCRLWLVDDTIRCAVNGRPLPSRRFKVAAA